MNLTFMNEEQKKRFEEMYRKMLVIGISMLLMTAVYLVIAKITPPKVAEISNSREILFIRYTILGMSLITAFAIRIIRAHLLRRMDNSDFNTLLGRLFTSSLITLSLCESIAIMGLIGYLITGFILDFYFMLFLSLVSFAVHFPRKDQWRSFINLHSTALQNNSSF